MSNHAYNRLKLLSSSGTVSLFDGGKPQVSVLDEEVLENIKHVMPYGFSHKPKAGSQAHMMFPHGDRSFGIALVIGDERHVFDVSDGEVALHDDKGNVIHIKQDGTIEITGGKLVVNCDVKINGNLAVDGKIDATGKITGA